MQSTVPRLCFVARDWLHSIVATRHNWVWTCPSKWSTSSRTSFIRTFWTKKESMTPSLTCYLALVLEHLQPLWPHLWTLPKHYWTLANKDWTSRRNDKFMGCWTLLRLFTRPLAWRVTSEEWLLELFIKCPLPQFVGLYTNFSSIYLDWNQRKIQSDDSFFVLFFSLSNLCNHLHTVILALSVALFSIIIFVCNIII